MPDPFIAKNSTSWSLDNSSSLKTTRHVARVAVLRNPLRPSRGELRFYGTGCEIEPGPDRFRLLGDDAFQFLEPDAGSRRPSPTG